MCQLDIVERVAAALGQREHMIDGDLIAPVAPDVQVDRAKAQRTHPAVTISYVQDREPLAVRRLPPTRGAPQRRRRSEAAIVGHAALARAVHLHAVRNLERPIAVPTDPRRLHGAARAGESLAPDLAVADPNIGARDRLAAVRAQSG